MFRSSDCRFVVAIGGGSAIDAGKAIAAVAANPGDATDYLEVIGKGQPLDRPSASVHRGTDDGRYGIGSHAQRCSRVARARREGESARSADAAPRGHRRFGTDSRTAAAPITASTGLDALTQLIEPYVCSRANPMTDALCVDGMRDGGGEFAARVYAG